MGREERPSNYERMKESMSRTFLKCDQEDMIRRFSLAQDQMYLYIRFLGREYRINRATGRVSWSDNSFITEEPGNYNEAMTLYDVLSYPGEKRALAHEWVNIDSLSPIQGGSMRRGSGLFREFETYFDGKARSLAAACEALGGRPAGKGDAAYELDLFTFLPISLGFWESDDEFPASLQILVDHNIRDFMHYETLMFAVIHLLERLQDLVRADAGQQDIFHRQRKRRP